MKEDLFPMPHVLKLFWTGARRPGRGLFRPLQGIYHLLFLFNSKSKIHLRVMFNDQDLPAAKASALGCEGVGKLMKYNLKRSKIAAGSVEKENC
jgi:hypothetical protein